MIKKIIKNIKTLKNRLYLSAARSGNTLGAILCIRMGADVDTQDVHGDSALINAIYSDNQKTVHAVAKENATIGLQNSNGKDALDIANIYGRATHKTMDLLGTALSIEKNIGNYNFDKLNKNLKNREWGKVNLGIGLACLVTGIVSDSKWFIPLSMVSLSIAYSRLHENDKQFLTRIKMKTHQKAKKSAKSKANPLHDYNC